MGLSEYTGLTPPGFDEGTEIRRIAPHRLWDRNGATHEACVHCGRELALAERHLLVRLTVAGSPSAEDRRYLCDGRCADEWLAESRERR
ncbi:hypothetical protein ACNS7O_10420 [Haloferacaceae archaeon DSL9]